MASSAQPSASATDAPSFGTALMRFAIAFPLMTAAMVLVSAIPGWWNSQHALAVASKAAAAAFAVQT